MEYSTKDSLIEALTKEGYLKTPSIIEAFQKIDRKDFVGESNQPFAYLNQALAIGHEQTISQPLTVAFMLELLEPKAGEKILDVGAGSGWQTALLAQIVNGTGKIVAIERIDSIAEFAKTNLEKYQFQNIDLIAGDGSMGFLEEAPFDKIIAAATAETIPLAWQEQLKIGGRIVAPIKESIVVLDKISQANFVKKEYFGFNFVPLISVDKT